ncbi:hypothetical protein AKJ16_DCAP08985 [Drosera capensis]
MSFKFFHQESKDGDCAMKSQNPLPLSHLFSFHHLNSGYANSNSNSNTLSSQNPNHPFAYSITTLQQQQRQKTETKTTQIKENIISIEHLRSATFPITALTLLLFLDAKAKLDEATHF